MDHDDSYFDKALEGFAMFALNQGEVCTCPSRVLVEEKIYDRFMERALKRVSAITQGHPLDSKTPMIGAQASQEQLEKILSYIDLGKQEGAECLIGGERNALDGELKNGYYIKPTVFRGNNKMRIFQEEIFGPVVSVTKPSRTKMKHWRLPTTRCTVSAPVCGRATARLLIAWDAAFRRAACGPIAITRIRRMRHLAVTSNRALAGRITR